MDDVRHLIKTRHPGGRHRRSRDDLIVSGRSCDGQRRDDAVLPDGIRQIRQGIGSNCLRGCPHSLHWEWGVETASPS